MHLIKPLSLPIKSGMKNELEKTKYGKEIKEMHGDCIFINGDTLTLTVI
jgi:hypothetical protein